MIIDTAKDKDYLGVSLVTVECSICGAKKGDDYAYFASHLAEEHGPEDVGLSPFPPSPARGAD